MTLLISCNEAEAVPLTNLVCNFRSQALLINHLLPDIGPGHLVELVNGGGNRADEIFGHTANLEEAIEDLPGVKLDGILPLPTKAIEDFVDDPDLGALSEPKNSIQNLS
jgi:hypothetical protein